MSRATWWLVIGWWWVPCACSIALLVWALLVPIVGGARATASAASIIYIGQRVRRRPARRY